MNQFCQWRQYMNNKYGQKHQPVTILPGEEDRLLADDSFGFGEYLNVVLHAFKKKNIIEENLHHFPVSPEVQKGMRLFGNGF